MIEEGDQNVCRRCSECTEEHHHWMPDADDAGAHFACKHCPATCESVTCEACDEEVPHDSAAYDTEDGVYICAACQVDT